MTNLILPRRRFLFLAPAIVAASSLMPGHSIAKLLEPAPPALRQFTRVAYGTPYPYLGFPHVRAGAPSRVAWGILASPLQGGYGCFVVPLTDAERVAYLRDPRLLGLGKNYVAHDPETKAADAALRF